jgi:HSP20 family molecular chaperone IbpA
MPGLGKTRPGANTKAKDPFMNDIAKQNTETQAPAQPVAVECEHEYIRPVVDIRETQQGYVLEAEMPGVKKEGVNVHLEGNVLTVEGRRSTPALPETGYFYRESSPADFRRSFELDPAIEADKISARMEQGILTLTLPKAEAAKPRKIVVA